MVVISSGNIVVVSYFGLKLSLKSTFFRPHGNTVHYRYQQLCTQGHLNQMLHHYEVYPNILGHFLLSLNVNRNLPTSSWTVIRWLRWSQMQIRPFWANSTHQLGWSQNNHFHYLHGVRSEGGRPSWDSLTTLLLLIVCHPNIPFEIKWNTITNHYPALLPQWTSPMYHAYLVRRWTHLFPPSVTARRPLLFTAIALIHYHPLDCVGWPASDTFRASSSPWEGASPAGGISQLQVDTVGVYMTDSWMHSIANTYNSSRICSLLMWWWKYV